MCKLHSGKPILQMVLFLLLTIGVLGCEAQPITPDAGSTQASIHAVFTGSTTGREMWIGALTLTMGRDGHSIISANSALRLSNGSTLPVVAGTGPSSFMLDLGHQQQLRASGHGSANVYTGRFTLVKGQQQVASAVWSAQVLREPTIDYAFLTAALPHDYSGALILPGEKGDLLRPDGTTWKVDFSPWHGRSSSLTMPTVTITIDLGKTGELVCQGKLNSADTVKGFKGSFQDPHTRSSRGCDAQLLSFSTQM